MFSDISARYDLANHILSLNLDKGWRRRLTNWSDPQPHERVLDVCTGTADILLEFSHRSESLALFGLDLSREMLEIGQRKLRIQRSDYTALLIEGDALQLPFSSESVDIATIAFGLRNLPDISAGLRELVRILKPGGRLLILEFTLPPNLLWRSFYLFYLRRIVPWLGALITGSRSAYEYLHRSICGFPPPDEIVKQMEHVGLTRVESLLLLGGIAAIYRGVRI